MSEIKNFICFDDSIYREKEIRIDAKDYNDWKIEDVNNVSSDMEYLNPIGKMNVKMKASKKVKDISKNERLICTTTLPIAGAGFQNIVITRNCILLSNNYSLTTLIVNSHHNKDNTQDQSICRISLSSANSFSEIEKELVKTANTYYKLMSRDDLNYYNYVDILIYLNRLLTLSMSDINKKSEIRVKELNKTIK